MHAHREARAGPKRVLLVLLVLALVVGPAGALLGLEAGDARHEARVVRGVADQLPDLLPRGLDRDLLLDSHGSVRYPMSGSVRSAWSAVSVSCICADDVVVDLVEVGVLAVALLEVDRLEHLDRDLRRRRHVAEHVADVQAPRQRQRDRQHLQPEHRVEAQQLGEPLAAAEEERGLLPADRDHGHERHVLVERQADEALAPAEVDLRALPARAVHLVVAARVDEQRGAGVERLVGVLGRGGDRAVLAQEAEARHGEHEVVGELVEAPLDAEVGVEGEREHAGVGREVAAGVVAHHQHRALGRDALEAAHLAAEPEAREQPQAGQRLADVVGIALVEVGLGHAQLRLAGDGAEGAADQRGGARRREREVGGAQAEHRAAVTVRLARPAGCPCGTGPVATLRGPRAARAGAVARRGPAAPAVAGSRSLAHPLSLIRCRQFATMAA